MYIHCFITIVVISTWSLTIVIDNTIQLKGVVFFNSPGPRLNKGGMLFILSILPFRLKDSVCIICNIWNCSLSYIYSVIISLSLFIIESIYLQYVEFLFKIKYNKGKNSFIFLNLAINENSLMWDKGFTTPWLRKTSLLKALYFDK